jgi:hypothetical protein
VTKAGPNLRFPLEPVKWPSSGVRRASVNSFGYGGTNAHVVIDDALSFLQERRLTANHCTEALTEILEIFNIDGIQNQGSDSTSTDNTPSDSPEEDEVAETALVEPGEPNQKFWCYLPLMSRRCRDTFLPLTSGCTVPMAEMVSRS